MESSTALNTHIMYDTVSHEHLDSLVSWATGEFPDAGLSLVECADGRWFLEVDHGDAFNSIAGISKPEIAPFVEPTFFKSEEEAQNFAFACIKQVYPELESKDLSEYYSDDE